MPKRTEEELGFQPLSARIVRPNTYLSPVSMFI